MTIAYIGIGSNIEPEKHVPAAVLLLREYVRVTGVSTFYRTDAFGSPGSPLFINGVVRIYTDLAPRELKTEVLRRIEDRLGRERTEDKLAPRTIDLDIIVFGEIVIREPDLIIPDPGISDRGFIAVPLLELDPGLVLPDTGKSLAEIVDALPAASMVPLADFTRVLRLEIGNEP